MNVLHDPALWWIPMTTYIIMGFVVARWIEKKIVGLPSRTQRLLWQYVFCFSFAAVYWAVGDRTFDRQMLVIFLIGVGNGLSVYIRWKAVHISLSGTSVLAFLDDLIAMLLSFLFLAEGRFLNPTLGIGVLLSVGSIVLMAMQKRKNSWPPIFFLYVGSYSVLWGVSYFSQRLFAVGGLAPAKYLFAWYGGSFLAAILIRLFWRETGATKLGRSLAWREVGMVMVLAFSAFTTVFLALNVLKHLPQIAFQPILLVSEAIIPTLLGLIVFGEHQHYSLREKVFLASAVVGVVLIAIGIG